MQIYHRAMTNSRVRNIADEGTAPFSPKKLEKLINEAETSLTVRLEKCRFLSNKHPDVCSV